MSVRSIEAEVSIKSGIESECSIGREVIVEVHDDVNLESLNVTANGNYEPPEGVDGYSDVTVNVPERIPVTESLSVTENGTYEPTEGIDGYDRVVVDVSPTIPDIEPLTVTENGIYTASGDGFNPVTVNVPIPTDPNVCEGEFIGTETGVLTIDTGYEGDSFPKIIEITPKSGIFSDEFINAVLPYSICAFVTVKKTAAAPLYNGKSSDVYVSAYTYYNGSAFVGNYIGSAYVCAQANPDYSASKVIRCSDNKTIKLFTADENSGDSPFFPCGVVFKYRVVY